MNTKVDEGKLISKKQAATAFIDGEDVEFMDQTGQWRTILDNTVLKVFLDRAQFRLKPRTIPINEIEVPACGVDYKPHTFMFVLNSLEPCEYSKIILDESDEIPPYWWSTEEEIKQVVAALRQVFGGSHDN
ncbi:hypothetical protein [Acinetobacter sp. F9]|uniref:hypothetical protein n=1 Tax=Acinetobacter sp. F9 TaxID=2853158 RepID=UPI001C45E6FD|nr:hypothetical protein [Acinetobacter sp. F9]